MATRSRAAVLLALLAAAAVLSSSAEGRVPGVVPEPDINFSQSIGTPNAPHHVFCQQDQSAICNSIAARLQKVTRLSLAEAIIDGARVKALSARGTFSKLAQKSSGMTRSCFSDCSESFDSLAYDMDTALQALKDHDPDTAKSNVDAALTETETCNDCFEVDNEYMPPDAAPIIKNLQKWARSAVAIDMTKVLDNKN